MIIQICAKEVILRPSCECKNSHSWAQQVACTVLDSLESKIRCLFLTFTTVERSFPLLAGTIHPRLFPQFLLLQCRTPQLFPWWSITVPNSWLHSLATLPFPDLAQTHFRKSVSVLPQHWDRSAGWNEWLLLTTSFRVLTVKQKVWGWELQSRRGSFLVKCNQYKVLFEMFCKGR